MGAKLSCEAKPFIDSTASWLDINKAISSIFKPYSKSEFDSWFGTESSGSQNPVQFIVSHYGMTLCCEI
jgi:hypothetical protein